MSIGPTQRGVTSFDRPINVSLPDRVNQFSIPDIQTALDFLQAVAVVRPVAELYEIISILRTVSPGLTPRHIADLREMVVRALPFTGYEITDS